MGCKLECSLKGKDPEKMTEELMKMAKSQGFTFRGDTTRGTFEYKGKVTAKGEYKRSGKNLIITVTKYPFFVTCGMIVSEINKILAKYLSCEKMK